MNSFENAVKVESFDAEDQRIAKRLGIVIPELWMTNRYEERLAFEGLSMQVDPDNLIKAYDRLEVSLDRGGFGVVFDSLGYDEGAETKREYQLPRWYQRDFDHLPILTLEADPTPTSQEKSAELADFGLLLGSCVMVDLIEDSIDLEDKKSKKANRLNNTGIVAQLTTSLGNLGAIATGVYEAVPYAGSGIGYAIIAGGFGARIATMLKSRNLKSQELSEFTEDEIEDTVSAVAKDARIITYQSSFGSTESTRIVLRSIRDELDSMG
jgi:hypothetical protein